VSSAPQGRTSAADIKALPLPPAPRQQNCNNMLTLDQGGGFEVIKSTFSQEAQTRVKNSLSALPSA